MLENHNEKIQNLENDVTELKVNYARIDERLNTVENGQSEIKTLFLQGHNSILQTLQQLVLSKDNIQITKSNNKTNITIQALILIGGMIGAFFMGKG